MDGTDRGERIGLQKKDGLSLTRATWPNPIFFCAIRITWQNDTFDERREAVWGVLKIDAIKDAFDYPDEYLVDRDIVHRIAFDKARQRGLSLEPINAQDLVHDLKDVFQE